MILALSFVLAWAHCILGLFFSFTRRTLFLFFLAMVYKVSREDIGLFRGLFLLQDRLSQGVGSGSSGLITIPSTIGTLSATIFGLGCHTTLDTYKCIMFGLTIGDQGLGLTTRDYHERTCVRLGPGVMTIALRCQIEACICHSTGVTYQTTIYTLITLATHVCGLAIIGAHQGVGNRHYNLAGSSHTIAFFTK